MMKQSIVKTTLIYFMGNVLSKIIVFFMLPIYTKYIPSGDMGFYDTATAVVTFFSSVLFLDIGSGIMRFMMERENDKKYHAIYSGLVIFLCSLLLYTITSIVIGQVMPFEYYTWIISYGFLSCIVTVFGYIARGLGYNKLFAFGGLASSVVNIAINLLLILVLNYDYSALYIASCAGLLVNFVILESKCKIVIKFRPKYVDRVLLHKMFIFSLPLCVNSIAYWFLNSSNKLIVSYMLGTEQTGYLTIANKFTSALYLISNCITLAWQELSYSKNNNDKNIGQFYSKAIDLYFKALMVGLLFLIPVIKIGLALFPQFIDISYIDSISLIPLALLGAIMSILSSFLGTIFGGIKQTKHIFWSTMSGAIINVVVLILLIQLNVGVMAANISFLLGFMGTVIFRIAILNHEIGVKFKNKNLFIFLPLFILECVLFEMDWKYNLMICFVYSFVLCIIYWKQIINILKTIKVKLSERV